ncbi:MAG: hypothetical protein JWM19_1167 [Actinomycetia bacterium]|nr:hypothetical protein [Actinomycetes bacterium]
MSVQDADQATAASPRACGGKPLSVALTVADVLLAIGAGVMVIFLHDVHFVLSEPYWLDEAWVADSVRAPLGLIPRLASSTPLGWTLLLRLVPAGGLQRQRLVPLIFAGLAVAAGYLLGRELRLTRFAAGLLTAAAVLLSPAMLVRDDLKQYTAEAFATLLIWLLVARVENTWSRWRLTALGLTVSLGTLFAETAIFTGGAAFTCLFLEALARRKWRRLAEVAVAGAGTLVIYGVIFLTVVRPRIDPELSSYWAPLYSPTQPAAEARFFWRELSQPLAPYLGFPAAHGTTWQLTVPLILAGAGVVALALLGRYALAGLLPVTLLVVATASAARQYPFGDERTSTFWLVMFPVLMAIAVAALIHGFGRLPGRYLHWKRARYDRRGPGCPRDDTATGQASAGSRGHPVRPPEWYWTRFALPVVAVAAGAAVIICYLQQVRPDVNSHLLAHDDPRSQIAYAKAHARPGDVYLVDFGASYAFAYYYRTPAPAYPAVPGNAAGFIPQYPGDSSVIIMTTRNAGDFARALRQAIAVVDAEPAGEHGRVWIIREHEFSDESLAWRSAFIRIDATGGKVTLYDVSKLGYSPGYTPVALVVPPPLSAHPS